MKSEGVGSTPTGGFIMRKKKTIEDEVNEFLEYWDCDQMCAFLRDVIPLFELYDVDEQDDWLRDRVGEEDERNVRLIRTVYLISRIAEFHTGYLASVKVNFKNIHQRLEKEGQI